MPIAMKSRLRRSISAGIHPASTKSSVRSFWVKFTGRLIQIALYRSEGVSLGCFGGLTFVALVTEAVSLEVDVEELEWPAGMVLAALVTEVAIPEVVVEAAIEVPDRLGELIPVSLVVEAALSKLDEPSIDWFDALVSARPLDG